MDDSCTYCGAYAEARDHVIPNSWIRDGRKYTGDWTVPACEECNGMLGCELIVSVPGRADFLYSKYRKKYKKLMLSPVWTAAEMNALGPNLQSFVRQSMQAQAELDRRLAHLQVIRRQGWDYLRPKGAIRGE